jgi:hypothetical protein
MEPVSPPADEPDTQEFALVAPLRLSASDVLGRCAVMVGLAVPVLFVVALMVALATR